MSRPLAALFSLSISLVLGGCYGDVGIPITIAPAHAPQFGDVSVTITGDLASLGEVDYFSLGGVQVIDATWSAGSVTFTTQGAPNSGPADVVIRGSGGKVIRHNVFTFDAPVAGVGATWMAFGASMTQGTESSGIDAHTQLEGVTAQVARAAGMYIGLPIFNPQVTPPGAPSDYYPDCSKIPGTGAGIKTITAVATDPSTGMLDLRRGRVDWTLQARDVASGGAKVEEIDHGVTDPQSAILAHIVNDPTVDASDAFGSETTSQIDRIELADPDVGFTTDLLANDLDAAVIQPDDLHAELITPLAKVQPFIADIMARLGKLHGDYFIANIPSLTFLPNVTALRAQRIADGSDTAASFDAKVKNIDDITASYDAALTAAMAPYPNLHLVDFKGYVDGVRNGVRIGGEWLTPAKFDGLISLDGLHLTDTGYALYANKFIDALNQLFGAAIPSVDVVAVHAQDPLAPSKLRAAGLSCVPPPQ